MRHRLTDILQSRLRIEGEDLAVSGAWLDAEGGALRYLGVDVGGWLTDRTALVAAGLVTWDGEGWRADTTRAAVEDATLAPEGGLSLDLTNLPPLITGPFGNTVSPLLMAAGLRASAAEASPPLAPGEGPAADDGAPGPEERTRRLETWEELHGVPVFARDGEVGTISDVILDDRAWDIAELVALAPGGLVPIAWDRVRRRVEAGGHFVLSADLDDVLGAEPG